MMPARREAVAAWAVAVALLVVGCSSGDNPGGPPRGVTTTTSATTSTTTGYVHPPPTAAPSRVVANLGECPKRAPVAAPATLNPGIQGLSEKLVPIAARSVRVCQYSDQGEVVGRGVLGRTATARVETETNQLAVVAPDYSPTCPANVPVVLLTFASDSQRAHVIVHWCAMATNGERQAQANSEWLDKLMSYTA
jgi:hypothetical protein